MNGIKKIILNYRWHIIKIYLYMFLGQLFYLLEPHLLGRAIDELILGKYNFLSLLLFAFIMEGFFIYKRMVLDTKIYMKIYNEIVLEYFGRTEEIPISSKIARTDMASSIVNFFENDLQYFILSVMSIFGSLYFIFLGSKVAGFISLMAIVPTILITKVFYKKISQGTRLGNTHYEKKVDTFQTNNLQKIKSFLERRKKILIASSTLYGRHWASLSSTKSIFLILAIIAFTHNKPAISHGEIVTMYAYINQFLGSILSIPVAVDVFTRINDVLSRLKENEIKK